MSLEKIEL